MLEIFTTEACPMCKMLKDKLITKGIAFKENHDLDGIIKLGFETVPVLKTEDGEYLDFGKANVFVNSL